MSTPFPSPPDRWFCSAIWVKSLLRAMSHPSSDQGLTLLEAVMALLVVAIASVLITPPILVATATRVQTQRAEQAQQIAQAEVDRVRTLVNRGAQNINNLPTAVDAAALNAIAPPDGTSGLMRSTGACDNPYTGQQVAATKAVEVDITGDCEADFVMQVFRTNGVPEGATQPINFDMGVRVYAVIRGVDAVPWDDLETDPAPLKMTTGEGSQNTNPLSVIYSNITQGDTRNSLDCYQNACAQ